MNNKLIISLILPTILLTSCGVPKEAIYVTKNLDNNYVINVDEDDIVNMLSNDMSFALYFYTNNCESCNQTKVSLNKYYQKNKSTIYGYVPTTNYQKLIDYDSNIFTNYIYTPTIMVFENGNKNFEIARSKYSNYDRLSSSLNTFLLKTNAYTTTRIEGYNYFIENYDQYIIYFYDNASSNSIENYKNYIEPNISKDIPMLLIDMDIANSDLSSYIKEKYQQLDTYSSYIVYKNNSGEIIQNHEIEATIAAIYSSN